MVLVKWLLAVGESHYALMSRTANTVTETTSFNCVQKLWVHVCCLIQFRALVPIFRIDTMSRLVGNNPIVEDRIQIGKLRTLIEILHLILPPAVHLPELVFRTDVR